jgi:hypothetical protein
MGVLKQNSLPFLRKSNPQVRAAITIGDHGNKSRYAFLQALAHDHKSTVPQRERRQERRFVANLQVVVALSEDPSAVVENSKIVDISENGLSFISSRLLATETMVTVEHEDCLLLCEVRNCRIRQYSSRGDEYIAGVVIRQVMRGERRSRDLVDQCGARG